MKRLLVLALLITSAANASSYDYECFSYAWNNNGHETDSMELTVNARKATAEIGDVSWDENLGGAIVQDYRSRGAIPFVKYGKGLIVEKSLITGGRRLRDGSWGGFVNAEFSNEYGFNQFKYICKLR